MTEDIGLAAPAGTCTAYAAQGAATQQPVNIPDVAAKPNQSVKLLGNTIGCLRVFDVSSTATVARIPVGGLPHVVKVTPSGRYVFVTNVASNSISEINPISNKVIRTIPVPGKHPLGLVFVR